MTHRKLKLPSKSCLGCVRAFAWRNKSARDWEQVKFCSERRRRHGSSDRTGHDRLQSGSHSERIQ
ncbi:DUF2256 domain-containing protein [Sphingobium sp. Leaf26]|uniref:DUF2256 domain-containing protein n=1 Tax=Sphingobium sp. Leaf26 TaxID=1735693 RepID=UPI0009EB6254|nr:DUF2256 domain-containing protein [Sphingobium sp. Leaf26]